jgi:hypothetical protein
LPPCTIECDFSGFRNEAKAAAKRHRSFADELQAVLQDIESDPLSRGDQIPLGSDLHIRKVRIGCSKERVAERDGYRLIIQIIRIDDKVVGRCLSVYYKPDQSNISNKSVKELARNAALQADSRSSEPK